MSCQGIHTDTQNVFLNIWSFHAMVMMIQDINHKSKSYMDENITQASSLTFISY
jgi:hypothetical protein